MQSRKVFSLAVMVGCVIGLNGCDPNKLINNFFSDLGLNRLAILRTDVKPGAIILSDGKKTMNAGNIDKYISGGPMKTTEDKDAVTDFQAAIPSYTAKNGLDASASLKFLDSVLPVSLSGALKLNGEVDLDQISASVQRMEPDEIETLLNDSARSKKLTDKLQEKWGGNYDIYIAYETYSSKSFSLKTTDDSSITADLEVSQTKLITNGNAKLSITRSSTSTLKVEGDTPYVFAFRAAKVEPRNGWRLRVMDPPPNTGRGTKAATEQYSALIHASPLDAAPVVLVDSKNGLD